MKFLYSDLPEFHVGGKKLVGRVVFALLLLASALIGALSGLLIVYSTDLPQISDLERYRPSTITELYDAHGQIVGSLLSSAACWLPTISFPGSCVTPFSQQKIKVSSSTGALTSGVCWGQPTAILLPAPALREHPR